MAPEFSHVTLRKLHFCAFEVAIPFDLYPYAPGKLKASILRDDTGAGH